VALPTEQNRKAAGEGYDTSVDLKGYPMAKKRKRKHSKNSRSDVKNEMRRYKRGKAKSGPGGKGGKVKSRKQAIAIGLSKARKKGKKYRRESLDQRVDVELM
jgi:hypothetical protein